MKIGYYIHHTTMSAGGIFTYSIGILRELLTSSEIGKIIIITSNNVASKIHNYIKDEKIEIRIVDRNNILINLKLLTWYVFYFLTIIFQSLIPANKFFHFLKRTAANLNPYQKIISSSKIDVFHIPVQYSPIYKTIVPVIVTMHDLQEYHFPHYFSFKERLSRKIKNKMSINDSDHIIVSFNHVKNDIINFFKVEDRKVSVCAPPFAESWFLEKHQLDWDSLAKKYDLKKNYLLYPAATWKHKNHLNLLDAFKKIVDNGLDYKLVCTGNKTELFYSVIKKRIEELKLTDTVQFLGIVPEEDLIGLYRNTSLVVIPTQYEAGSGPLYEAMRYQVPVICSNVTSLPDTIQNVDFLFNPNDVNEIAEKIKMILTNKNFRKENIENSKMRIKYLKNIDYLKNFIHVYRTIK
jgi:glycosyltransferase involved in cell wall biosynthesis